MASILKTLANVTWAADYVSGGGDPDPSRNMSEWSRSNGIRLDQQSALAMFSAARLGDIRQAPESVSDSYLDHLQVAQHDACGVLDFFRTPVSAPKKSDADVPKTTYKAASTEELQAVIESLLKQLQQERSRVSALEAERAKCEFLRTTALPQAPTKPSAIDALPSAVRPKSERKPPSGGLPPLPTKKPAEELPPAPVSQQAGPPIPPPAPIFGRPKVPDRSPPRERKAPPPVPERKGVTLLDSEDAKRLLLRAQQLQGNDPKTEDTDADWSAASISAGLDSAMTKLLVHQVCEAGQIYSYHCCK